MSAPAATRDPSRADAPAPAPAPTAASAFPAELSQRELAVVRARRAALGLPFTDGETTGRVGLAISGGGIRSATFALGVLQSLARLGRLRHVDYLSTVSGGGYIGSFLGSLYLPVAARNGAAAASTSAPAASSPPASSPAGSTVASVSPSAAQTADRVEHTLADADAPPVRWLREYGRYMAPRGAGDYLYAVGIYLRNWISLHYVLAVTLLAGFLAGDLLRALLWQRFAAMRALEASLFAGSTAGLWWSPWFVLPLAGFALALVPLGWAYWLTQTRQDAPHTMRNPALFATFLVALAAAAVLRWPPALAYLPAAQPDTVAAMAAWLLVAAAIASGAWFVARIGSGSDGMARNHLSRWLGSTLSVVLALAGFALVDSLGQNLYLLASAEHGRWWATLVPLGSAVVVLVQRFAPLIGRLGVREAGLRLSAASALSALGIVLFALLMAGWSAVGHALLWSGQCAACGSGAPAPQATTVAAALAAMTVISLLTGRTIPFLNLSTLAQFYAARLTRAYLGASNARRTGYRADPPAGTTPAAASALADVTRASASDDIRWQAYRPDLHGGPLHFVNVTLNETVTGAAQLTQRDRKGMSMAVGPHGLSVGRHHHALWNGSDARIAPLALPPGRFAMFPADPHDGHGVDGHEVESLGVGQWIAVSGAAFTTGLGSRTRMGLSMLLALSNVRLGYWWDSGVDPGRRRERSARGALDRAFAWLAALAPVQAYLANETFARFHGAHRRRWYLSDGGHFENTAVYELLRRRVPFIVVCDDGQDRDYAFEDAGNLVRKARIDWDAEIRFLSGDEIVELLGAGSPLLETIGTPAQLQRRARDPSGSQPVSRLHGQAYSERHATLAWARYGDDAQARSLLLFVKPTLVGDEPLDLQDYFARHPDFPQESTLDQSFDEAQWESYRRLGEHIGQCLFGVAAAPGRWAPYEMRAPASAPPRAGTS
jgi:hypothetical protein